MTQTRPMPQPGILDIAPYKAGEGHVAGANAITKLSSNENPHGPSPAAMEAVRAAAETLAVYPSSDHAALRTAIGEVWNLDPARIVCGAGSDEIISLLCQSYAGPGDEVLYTEHGFAMYPISAMAAGATPVQVRERHRTADVDALLEAVTERTAMVFIANPNNPTGTMLPPEELARLAAGLPGRVMLVLDGAYAEYVPGYDAGAALVDAHENVVMTRTFSKIYGLGGLRIGWGYAPAHVIEVLNRVRGPFNVSAAGLAAAEAAVRDTAYTERCRAANAEWRGFMQRELNALGLPTDESHANFVLPRFPGPEMAAAADQRLRAHGIIVRPVGGYGLPDFLRITIGDEVACRRVIAILDEFLKERA
ncbi:histidinol-phosphate transaminase [Halovulum dunhuangense]|uniref:Histidinol-phosphate aminotransferase n=1 Tax=Halovulum dunhuangense TaxID=1505036 RepID=A0A849KZG7_9RHOB|nr:histidinol-phosphate transaminase [Halovulum dunhuangense]NNU79592.1 histidinol-phosphate transaminase [Halovulum dunhuangense]